jgi:cyanophycinase
MSDVEMGAPVSIDNLIVHVMALGDHYDLKNKKLTIHKPSDFAI